MIKEEDKESEIHLIFANKKEKDIILLNELEYIKTKINLKIYYFLEEINHDTNIDRKIANNINIGLISEKFLDENFSKYSKDKDFLIMACGSKKMTNDFISPILKKLNFKDENIFIY
jgi:NAD(P)H-flavin reductase